MTAEPRTDAGRDPATCAHIVITTYGDGENGPSLWACDDCHLRFYPARQPCVDVGHRNIKHPSEASSPAREELRTLVERNARRMDPDAEPVLADDAEVVLYATAGEFRLLRAALSSTPDPALSDRTAEEDRNG